jgi:transcription elongation factor Elf1
MGRVMREVLVCDVCGSEEDVAAVSVTLDGAEQTSELCAEHRRQLQEAVSGIMAGSAPSRPTRRARKTADRAATAGTPPAEEGVAPQRGRMPRATCPHCNLEMSVQNLGRHIAAKHPGTV